MLRISFQNTWTDCVKMFRMFAMFRLLSNGNKGNAVKSNPLSILTPTSILFRVCRACKMLVQWLLSVGCHTVGGCLVACWPNNGLLIHFKHLHISEPVRSSEGTAFVVLLFKVCIKFTRNYHFPLSKPGQHSEIGQTGQRDRTALPSLVSLFEP